MTDKDLKKLSRLELVDIIYEAQKRYEDCAAENRQLREALEEGGLKSASAAEAASPDNPASGSPQAVSGGEGTGGTVAWKKEKTAGLPSLEQIEKERKWLRYRRRYSRTLKSTVAILVVVAAVAVLVATLWMPVLRIYGSSMVPTLKDGQIVISVKTSDFEAGDIVAFYLGNKLLIKRYIAGPSEWVNIDPAGNVTVNGEALDEPYLTEKSYGQTDITLPYQVPDERYFLMGDNRDVSVDSRSSSVGCVAKDQIVGKVVFRIWPLSEFGPVK